MGEQQQQLEHDDKDKLDEQQPSVVIEDEVVVVLEGQEEEAPPTEQPPKRNPVRDMRKRIKEQNRENSDQSKVIRDLQAQLAAASKKPDDPPATDEAPTLEGCGYDTQKFQTEYSIWNDAQQDKKLDERISKRENREQQTTATEQTEKRIEGHYQRASDLQVGDYEQTEDAAVAVLGVNLVQSIQNTVDDSELIIYYLGKNPVKAAELSVVYEQNPANFTYQLGKLSGKITLRPKNGKGAPNPDIPVGGGGGSANATLLSKYLKKLAEASNADNPLAARKLVREQATSAGIDLPYNQV